MIKRSDLTYLDIKRFWEKVNKKGEDACWEWTGAKQKNNYGSFCKRGGKSFKKTQLAHRVSYVINTGELEKGKCVCHTCDNPSCVKPQHLFQASQKENIKDCIDKNRKLPPPSQLINLSEDIIKLIGTDFDKNIAKIAHVNRKTIGNKRNELGIKPFRFK